MGEEENCANYASRIGQFLESFMSGFLKKKIFKEIYIAT